MCLHQAHASLLTAQHTITRHHDVPRNPHRMQVGGAGDPITGEKVVSSTSPLFIGGPTFSLRSWGLAAQQPQPPQPYTQPPSPPSPPHTAQASHAPPSAMGADVHAAMGAGVHAAMGADLHGPRQQQTAAGLDAHWMGQTEEASGDEQVHEGDGGWGNGGQGSTRDGVVGVRVLHEAAGKGGHGVRSVAATQGGSEDGWAFGARTSMDVERAPLGPSYTRAESEQPGLSPSALRSLSAAVSNVKKKQPPVPSPFAPPASPPESDPPPPPVPSAAPPPPEPSEPTYVLPPYLSGYSPAQVKLLCLAEVSLL